MAKIKVEKVVARSLFSVFHKRPVMALDGCISGGLIKNKLWGKPKSFSYPITTCSKNTAATHAHAGHKSRHLAAAGRCSQPTGWQQLSLQRMFELVFQSSTCTSFNNFISIRNYFTPREFCTYYLHHLGNKCFLGILQNLNSHSAKLKTKFSKKKKIYEVWRRASDEHSILTTKEDK